MDGCQYFAYNAKTKQYDIPLDTEADEPDAPSVPPNVPITIDWKPATEEPKAAIATNDPVNHPSHYTSGKIEVIDFIEDQQLNFHLANALKYICRAGKKNPEKTKEDLEKAVWYIQRYICHVLNND